MKIIFADDKYGMNWLRQDFEYAGVTCPEGVTAAVENIREGDLLHTQITLKNCMEKPVFTSLTDIGIYFPLQDKYENSEVCIKERCHAHVYCGGDISYIMALRMGGEAPHLGMLLMEGSLGGYSVERDVAKMSNDRGCFILHPTPMELEPGEERRIRWTVFSHQGKEDFEEKISRMRRFVKVECSRYVIFTEESCILTISPSFAARKVSAVLDGEELVPEEVLPGRGVYYVNYKSSCPGERVFHIDVDGILTVCRIFVQEKLEKLADRRCRFLAGKQQYYGADKGLWGAYLVYDNEEKHCVYRAEYDYNAGRERVGMGLLMAQYLQAHKGEEDFEELEKSLQDYIAFVLRELVDVETGEVYNDFGRDDSYERLYNFSWYATLFVELYELYGKKDYLTYACCIIKRFYEKGGEIHYSIELPILPLCRALEQADMEQERTQIERLFRKHGNNIVAIGVNYPPFEVHYEQSIVAPAANILLQLALLTGEEKYLEAGRKQLAILELFNGRQPDYHLYETAIRHWDGYWFGKRKLYGDTFPHYWSGLTGNCYLLYYKLTCEEAYLEKAKASLRSVLSLLLPGGTGSCAYIFPASVNGIMADSYDPYANDQDWGLYFNLRMAKEFDLKTNEAESERV